MGDPDLNQPGQALASRSHLVVQDIFLTETAYLADVVLPASAWPEKTGTASNTDRMVQMGRRALNPPGDARPDLFEPTWEYDPQVGKSITGGVVYRGKKLPDLVGKYVYADYVSGKIWALKYDEATGKVVSNEKITIRIPAGVSIGLIICKLVRFFVPLKTTCSMKWEIPATLSVSCFEPTSTHSPTQADVAPSTFSLMTRSPFSSCSRGRRP